MNIELALMQGVHGFIVVCGFLLSFAVLMVVIGIITTIAGWLFGTGEDDDE